MSTIAKIIKLVTNKDYRFCILANLKFYNNMSDENFIRRKYRATIGKELDLVSPKTYNEKLQWLKLYDRNPEYTLMVDKYKVREYVADKIGEEHLIPLLGVWNSTEEIDFDLLPNQFVLKCNHNSGLGMCICKNKETLDIKSVKKKLRKGLAQNYFLTGREWPYKNVPRKIICEKYMTEEGQSELRDYKFYCFNGKVKMLGIYFDRNAKSPTKAYFVDREFNCIDMTWGYQKLDEVQYRPKKYEEMLQIAETLSEGIPEVRVDLYLCNEKIYFGELTFFDGSGFDKIEPEEWDMKMGSWIELPNS